MEQEIEINKIKYVAKDSIKASTPSKSLKGKKYVIVRTYSAGVFAGYLDKRVGKESTILQARRLWYWKGAASLSQLAEEGVKFPNECKFPTEVSKIEVTETIEVLDVTEKARLSIASVPVWKQ